MLFCTFLQLLNRYINSSNFSVFFLLEFACFWFYFQDDFFFEILYRNIFHVYWIARIAIWVNFILKKFSRYLSIHSHLCSRTILKQTFPIIRNTQNNKGRKKKPRNEQQKNTFVSTESEPFLAFKTKEIDRKPLKHKK